MSLISTIASLPPADDRIYGPHGFSTWWLLAGVATLLLAGAGLVWALRPSRSAVVVPERAPELDVRTSYLQLLEDLERRFVDQRLSPRALHHELSRTLRRFARDAGTVGATAMSAEALDAAGLGHLAAAVLGYERPQFDALPTGDPFAALGVARAVVSAATTPGKRVLT